MRGEREKFRDHKISDATNCGLNAKSHKERKSVNSKTVSAFI